MSREYDEEEIIAMINDCAARAKDLNDWESKLISSVGDAADSGIMLSQKQEDSLCDIWNRVT